MDVGQWSSEEQGLSATGAESMESTPPPDFGVVGARGLKVKCYGRFKYSDSRTQWPRFIGSPCIYSIANKVNQVRNDY